MDCKLPIIVVGGGLYKGMKGRRGTDAHSIQTCPPDEQRLRGFAHGAVPIPCIYGPPGILCAGVLRCKVSTQADEQAPYPRTNAITLVVRSGPPVPEMGSPCGSGDATAMHWQTAPPLEGLTPFATFH